MAGISSLLKIKCIQWILLSLPFLSTMVMNCPNGLDKSGWRLLVIVISMIVGFILKPVPISQIALLSLTASVLF